MQTYTLTPTAVKTSSCITIVAVLADNAVSRGRALLQQLNSIPSSLHSLWQVDERRKRDVHVTSYINARVAGIKPSHTHARENRSQPLHFVAFTLHTDTFAMDIVETKETTDPSLLKFKVGGAALIFEKVEDWKHHFQNLIVSCDIWQPMYTVDARPSA